MPTRTLEGDTLQEMTATLNEGISSQTEPFAFGEAMSSANFVASQLVRNAMIARGEGNYSKVSTIMAAVTSHISTQLMQEKRTQKFNEFVLILHNLRLDNLAQQLVEKLREKRPSYESPLGSSGANPTPDGLTPGGPPPATQSWPSSTVSRRVTSAQDGSSKTSSRATSKVSAARKHSFSTPQLLGCFVLLIGAVVVCFAVMARDPDQKRAAMRSSPGCLRPLKNEDRKGLSKYFGQACKSQTEAETLCADYLKLKNCNDLLRDSKLTPFHLANSYLEQNPRVCWADIVRVLCELSKDRLAMEVAEEYDMNIKDCSEQI